MIKCFMKRCTAMIVSIVIVISMNSLAFSRDRNIYGKYGNFEGLYEAYLTAVEADDIEKQAELMKLAEETLMEEIREAEASSMSNSLLRYDPDESYYQSLFPDYFDDGYWELRDSGRCLTLVPINAPDWNSSEKADAWNSTYAKFHSSRYWDNEDIMKKQFFCHARPFYNEMEAEWNLEPWRTSMNPITCN